MNRIFVPTDFSQCADAAAAMAINLAKPYKAHVHFLHMINTGMDWKRVPKEQEKNHPDVLKEIGEARAKLTALVQNAQRHGVEASESIAFNETQEDVLRHLDEEEHDLLVMGSYGAQGVKKVIGSNTQKVIQGIEIPALIVRKETNPTDLKRVVVASDFEDPGSKMMNIAGSLAKEFGWELALLFVNTPDSFTTTNAIQNRFNRLINERRIEASTFVVNEKSVEEGIAGFASSSDLVIVEYHKRSVIQRFLDPSITESLINYTQELVLCIPSGQ